MGKNVVKGAKKCIEYIYIFVYILSFGTQCNHGKFCQTTQMNLIQL